MEALLIINSLLVAISLYFIRDFHKDFKKVAKTVRGMKAKFSELSRRVNDHIKSVKERFEEIEEEK